jgi:glycosyltransferase involved in cell wall biosynthesis
VISNQSVDVNSIITLSLIFTGDDRRIEIRRLLDSIEMSIFDFNVEVIFVNQGKSIDYVPFLNKELLSFREVLVQKVSLSRARNIGLGYCKGEIVGFPDDDCWYSVTFLRDLVAFFKNGTFCAVCTHVEDPILGKSYGNRPKNRTAAITPSNMFRLPISVGIFVKRDVITNNAILFNENLGVGTKIGSGEETDFIFSLLNCNCSICYNGFLSVYHLLPDVSSFNSLKAFNYGYGFGYTNRIVYEYCGFRILPYLFNVLIRSFFAMLFYLIFDIRQTKMYFSRFNGIIRGFCKLSN